MGRIAHGASSLKGGIIRDWPLARWVGLADAGLLILDPKTRYVVTRDICLTAMSDLKTVHFL